MSYLTTDGELDRVLHNDEGEVYESLLGLVAAPEPELRPMDGREEDWVLLRGWLQALDDEDHEVLRFWMSGLTHKEIGAMLGVNREAIRRCMQRVFDHLRSQLRDYRRSLIRSVR
jgi:DNA-directed RNA polymerase specialized sigma24 family protein